MRFEDLGDVVGAICIGPSVLLVIAAVLTRIEGRRELPHDRPQAAYPS